MRDTKIFHSFGREFVLDVSVVSVDSIMARADLSFNSIWVESSQHNWVVATKTATVERLWKVDISFNAVRALTAVVRPHLAGEHEQAVQESEWDRRCSEGIFTTPQTVDNLKDKP